jgi:hypothetical protein
MQSLQELAAQTDSLILKNGNTIVGEIKVMDRGVLTIETGYSKSDFTIEWSGIKEIYSKSIFLITLTDGRRINGSVSSNGTGQNVNILSQDGQTVETLIDNIVFIKGLKSSFWSRLKVNLDFGLSLTKANDLRQFNTNARVNYLADKWELGGNYSHLKSSQDSVETTKRTDAAINYKYFLQKDWYLAASLSILSNTEQALKLRTIAKLGGGKFLIHNNRTYWAAGGGFSYNNESFTNNTPSRNSMEAYAGTELNIFDVGDLNLLSSLYVYPSLTESGRWRSDFKFDTKYDLPMDFYVKMGLTLNYDNRPAVAGNETDYVLVFSVGWEW